MQFVDCLGGCNNTKYFPVCGKGLDKVGFGILQQLPCVEGHCCLSWELTGLGELKKQGLWPARERATVTVAV